MRGARRREDIARWSGWRALRYSRLYGGKREIQSSRFSGGTNGANPKSVAEFYRVRVRRGAQGLRGEGGCSYLNRINDKSLAMCLFI